MALTTDIIVGFPGETDEDFISSLDFAEKMAFAQIHVFEYSPREGTPAAKLPNQVPAHVKAERGREMRKLAGKLRQDFLKAQIGTTAEVLFEDEARGYTENYCQVECQGQPNTIQQCLITSTIGDSLIGETTQSTRRKEAIYEHTKI